MGHLEGLSELLSKNVGVFVSALNHGQEPKGVSGCLHCQAAAALVPSSGWGEPCSASHLQSCWQFWLFLTMVQSVSVIPTRRSNSGQLSKLVPRVRLYPPWVCSAELLLWGAKDLPKSLLSVLYPRGSGLSSLAEGGLVPFGCSIMQGDHKDTLVQSHLPAFPYRLCLAAQPLFCRSCRQLLSLL